MKFYLIYYGMNMSICGNVKATRITNPPDFPLLLPLLTLSAGLFVVCFCFCLI